VTWQQALLQCRTKRSAGRILVVHAQPRPEESLGAEPGDAPRVIRIIWAVSVTWSTLDQAEPRTRFGLNELLVVTAVLLPLAGLEYP
jgi:hypothetical protein